MVNLKQAMSYPQTDTLTLPQNLTSNIAGEVTPQLLFEKAATTQPRVKEAEYKLRKSLLRVYVAKGMQLPTLTASGGYATSYSKNLIKGGDDAYTRQLKDLASHYVELNLRIPLFTGLKHRSDIRRSQLENLIEKANYEETMQQLYAEVSKAVAEYEGATEAVTQALRQQEAQDVAYQTNQRKYTDGLIGIIELHSSANNLLKAKVETLKAQALYAFSARIISYFEGNLFVDKL
jgi:outer membrane protein